MYLGILEVADSMFAVPYGGDDFESFYEMILALFVIEDLGESYGMGGVEPDDPYPHGLPAKNRQASKEQGCQEERFFHHDII